MLRSAWQGARVDAGRLLSAHLICAEDLPEVDAASSPLLPRDAGIAVAAAVVEGEGDAAAAGRTMVVRLASSTTAMAPMARSEPLRSEEEGWGIEGWAKGDVVGDDVGGVDLLEEAPSAGWWLCGGPSDGRAAAAHSVTPRWRQADLSGRKNASEEGQPIANLEQDPSLYEATVRDRHRKCVAGVRRGNAAGRPG